MDWKVLVLVATVVPNVIGLPLELCCHKEGHSITSASFNIEIPPSIYPVLESDMLGTTYVNPVLSTYQESSNHVIGLYEDNSCCGNSVTSSNAKDKAGRGGEFEETRKVPVSFESSHHRVKRFPIHLDPLYQYRYLARSGQCPTAKDGQPEFYCPTPDKMGNWRCIDDFQLCDGVRHCPNGEDELPVSCLFYRVVETHLHSVSQKLSSDESRKRSSGNH